MSSLTIVIKLDFYQVSFADELLTINGPNCRKAISDWANIRHYFDSSGSSLLNSD